MANSVRSTFPEPRGHFFRPMGSICFFSPAMKQCWRSQSVAIHKNVACVCFCFFPNILECSVMYWLIVPIWLQHCNENQHPWLVEKFSNVRKGSSVCVLSPQKQQGVTNPQFSSSNRDPRGGQYGRPASSGTSVEHKSNVTTHRKGW